MAIRFDIQDILKRAALRIHKATFAADLPRIHMYDKAGGGIFWASIYSQRNGKHATFTVDQHGFIVWVDVNLSDKAEVARAAIATSVAEELNLRHTDLIKLRMALKRAAGKYAVPPEIDSFVEALWQGAESAASPLDLCMQDLRAPLEAAIGKGATKEAIVALVDSILVDSVMKA